MFAVLGNSKTNLSNERRTEACDRVLIVRVIFRQHTENRSLLCEIQAMAHSVRCTAMRWKPNVNGRESPPPPSPIPLNYGRSSNG
jgi:hypothetical protein